MDERLENCESAIDNGVEKLEAKVAEIVKNPYLDDKVKTGKIISTVLVSQEHFSGPLPSPKTMKGYEDIVPGAAERILIMAEKQLQHRMQLENIAIPSQIKQSGRGQNFAFFLSVLLILFAIYCVYMGALELGGIVAGTTIIAVLFAFLRGKRVMRKDLDDKD